MFDIVAFCDCLHTGIVWLQCPNNKTTLYVNIVESHKYAPKSDAQPLIVTINTIQVMQNKPNSTSNEASTSL